MAKINFRDLAAAAEKQARENERPPKPVDETTDTPDEKAVEKSVGKTPGKLAGKAQAKAPVKAVGKGASKAPRKTAGKASDPPQTTEKAAPPASDTLYKFTTYIPMSLKMDLDIFVAQQKFMGVKCSRITVVEKALRAYLSGFYEV